jgi:hypothetical protein
MPFLFFSKPNKRSLDDEKNEVSERPAKRQRLETENNERAGNTASKRQSDEAGKDEVSADRPLRKRSRPTSEGAEVAADPPSKKPRIAKKEALRPKEKAVSQSSIVNRGPRS